MLILKFQFKPKKLERVKEINRDLRFYLEYLGYITLFAAGLKTKASPFFTQDMSQMKKPLAVAKIDAEMSLIPVRAHILCSMTNAVSSVPCHQHCLLSKVRARPLCVSQLQAQPAQPAAGLARPSQQCTQVGRAFSIHFQKMIFR